MPAAAVVPAPRVYIYAAAVKKLVVGSACSELVGSLSSNWSPALYWLVFPDALNRVSWVASTFTLKKIRVLNTGVKP